MPAHATVRFDYRRKGRSSLKCASVGVRDNIYYEYIISDESHDTSHMKNVEILTGITRCVEICIINTCDLNNIAFDKR